jgi:hypothetical protein
MNHKIASIAMFLLAVMGFSAVGFADSMSTGCSVATLNGTYGFYRTGITSEVP